MAADRDHMIPEVCERSVCGSTKLNINPKFILFWRTFLAVTAAVQKYCCATACRSLHVHLQLLSGPETHREM